MRIAIILSVAVAAILACVFWNMQNAAMETCLKNHSIETCWSTLAN
jgi:hypothetical protein